MLRKIRITAAAVFFTVITLLLLDFTGTLHAWFGWMVKVQLLPAVLAVNAGVVAALVLLTLLFGRVYCSVICPLGVFQDVVSRAAARRRKNRFRYSRALSWLRYGILVLFLVALAAHFKPVSNLLAPYSAYGRIVSNLFAPLYLWGNNLLAYLAERAGSYAFYTVDVWVKGAATLAVAAVSSSCWPCWHGATAEPIAIRSVLSARSWDSCRASRFSSRVSTPRNVTVAAFVPATARRRASTRRRTGSITAVAWPAWTVWGNAARERSPFRANPLPAANPLPWNLRP